MTVYENVESLYDFLKEHQDEIDYVMLDWVWSPNTVYIPTRYYFIHKGDHYPTLLYREVDYDRIDTEYCFYGNVEGAMKFAEQYECWDGHDLTLDDSILYARENAYNNDWKESARDDTYVLECDLEATDVVLGDYVFFRGGAKHYNEDEHGSKFRLPNEGDE